MISLFEERRKELNVYEGRQTRAKRTTPISPGACFAGPLLIGMEKAP
jgi:hypothetical protein